MRRCTRALLAVLMVFLAGGAMAQKHGTAASPIAADWLVYKQKFVTAEGRVVDDGNGGISHSESQGYGLLLASLADDQAGFEQIWSFTRTTFLLRNDGLAVWKLDPRSTPPISDINNATDGDILIAYALLRAGRTWAREDLTREGTALVQAIGRHLVSTVPGRSERDERKVLKPASKGFWTGERADAPVVNLSYWIFEAFDEFAAVAPEVDWQRLKRDGILLIHAARFGQRQLPPEWLSLKAEPRPAKGFDPEFSYNSVRIPLYLIRGGSQAKPLLEPFRVGMTGPDGKIAFVNLATGEVTAHLDDPGYRIIPSLISCILDGQKLPQDLIRFSPTVYYPSTLHLLALSFAAETHPECL